MNTPKNFPLHLILAALLLLFAAGCLPSLNPICTDQDLVAADELLGRWRKADPSNELTFAAPAADAPAKIYQLTWTDKGQTAAFQARFMRLDGQLIMDTFPDMDAAKKNLGAYEGHLVPAHYFFRIALDGDKLKIETLAGDAIEKHAKDLRLVQRPNDSVITAPTDQLQTLLKRHARDKNFWTETPDEHAFRKQ